MKAHSTALYYNHLHLAMPLPRLAFLPALFAFGCAETNIQAIRRLQPTYATYRHNVANVIVQLPPPGSVTESSVPKALYPAPVFFEDRFNDPQATAEIYYFEERNQNVSLSIRSPVSACLAWTGPKNPLHPDVWGNRSDLGQECENAAKRPWLVLLRVVESSLPERFFMEAFLIYTPAWTIAGSFPIRAYANPRAETSDAWGNNNATSFHQAIGCELNTRLNQLPGGKFKFDGRRCDGDFVKYVLPASMFDDLAPKESSKPKEIAGDEDQPLQL